SRTRVLVERPAFRTMVAGGLRPVQRTLALPPVEAAHVPAAKRDPHYALLVDVAAARAEARLRHVEDLGELGLRVETQHAAAAAKDTHGVPDRAVRGTGHHRIRARAAG